MRHDPTERDAPVAIAVPAGDFEAYEYTGGALKLLVRTGERDIAMGALRRLPGQRVGALVRGGTLLRGHNANDKAVVKRLERALAERRAADAAPPAPAAEAEPARAPTPAPDAVPAAAPRARRASRVDPERCAHCDEVAPRHLLLCPAAASEPPPRPEDDPRHWPAPAAPIVVRPASEPPPPPVAALVPAAPTLPRARRAPPVVAAPPAAAAPRPTCGAKDCDTTAGPVTERTHPEMADLCRRHRQTAYERAQGWGCSLADAAQTVREGSRERPASAPAPAAPPRPTCEAKDCDRARGRIQRNTNPELAPFCNECRQVVNDRSRYLVGGVTAGVEMLRAGTLRPGADAPATPDEVCTHCGKRPRGSLTTKTPPGTETFCGPCRRDAAMQARGTSRRPKHTMRGLKRGQRPTELRAAHAPSPTPATTSETTTMPKKTATKPAEGACCKAKDCTSPPSLVTPKTRPELAGFCQKDRQRAYERAQSWECSIADAARSVEEGSLERPEGAAAPRRGQRPGAEKAAPSAAAALCTRCEKYPQACQTARTPEGTETFCGHCRRIESMQRNGTNTAGRRAKKHAARHARKTAPKAAPRVEAPKPAAAPASADDFLVAALAPYTRALRVVERLGGIERAERIADAIEVA